MSQQTIIEALALAGPTAVGKSNLALALAVKINAEIISVDAGSFYRGMDIGSAKPSAAERRITPHHLLDICNPDESCNVGRFSRLALAAAEDIKKRGKVPLFVGGTMMYYKALCDGLHDLPPSSPQVRAELKTQIKKHGIASMHKELALIDAATAAGLQSSDEQRICRALEVYRLTGKPLSVLLQEKRQVLPLRLNAVLLMPPERRVLHTRIGERLDKMLVAGLVEETNTVINRFNLSPDVNALRLVGYKQAAAFLRGETDKATMRKNIYHATCQLAKRQLSWLRAWRQPLLTIDPFGDDVEGKITDVIVDKIRA